MLEKVHIRLAPLSNRIVLARFGKDSNVALETKDATSDFLLAIEQYVGVGNVLSFGDGAENQFELTLRKVSKEKQQ